MKKKENTLAPDNAEPDRTAAGGLTPADKRPRNEDCHLIREDLGLVIVAGGFAGAAGGDIAARLTVDEIAGCFGAQGEETLPCFEDGELANGLTVATVRFAIEHAHRRVRYEAQRTGPPGMCTAVAVLVVAGPHVVIGHAGRVRVHRLRGGALEQLTEAQDEPAVAPLACPVGAARSQARPTLRTVDWQPGDLYLFCTTERNRVLSAGASPDTFAADTSTGEGAVGLVRRAFRAGAGDHITAVVAIPGQSKSDPVA